MSIAKNLKVVVASSLLITLVSCGNDSKKSKPAMEPSRDQIVQSYDWKILNGRGFGAKALVEITLNGEVHTVINECHHKNIHKIDKSSMPHSLVLMNFENPNGATTADIKVFDLGPECNVAPTLPDVAETVNLNINKSGAIAEVLIEI